MVAAGIRMAVLHGEERLAIWRLHQMSVSLPTTPVGDVLAVTTSPWEEHGLYPMILWPYDVGGTGSIFLANEDATGGCRSMSSTTSRVRVSTIQVRGIAETHGAGSSISASG